MTTAKGETRALVCSSTRGQPILQRACACGQHTVVGGECAECSAKKLTLQRRAPSPDRGEGWGGEQSVPTIVHEVLRSSGQPLDFATRAFFEPGFGHDFSRVRVHSAASPMIQTKLAVSRPGDVYEQEADRLAETVMRMPDRTAGKSAASGSAGPPRIQRMCPECEEKVQRQPLDEAEQPVVDTEKLFPPEEMKRDEEEEARAERQTIMTKRVGSRVPLSAPADLGAQLARSTVGGAPLHAETRRFMEPRFDTSFAHVRVHADGPAAAMCASLGAKAFTYGRDIYFGTGWYRPGTKEGKHLLAHELAHVQQQGPNAGIARRVDHPVVQRACQDFPEYASPGTYCAREAEARANITRACPPYRDDFLYRDGPPTHPWRPIPGYGCAHHVAHILAITNGRAYENCRGGFSVTIGQITQGRAAHPLAEAQVNDIWSTGGHSGVVRQVDAAAEPPRVRVDQCGVGGNAQDVWFDYGDVYR